MFDNIADSFFAFGFCQESLHRTKSDDQFRQVHSIQGGLFGYKMLRYLPARKFVWHDIMNVLNWQQIYLRKK